LSSGQTPEQAPQGPYPQYGPQYAPVHKPSIDYIRPFASDVMLALGVIVGLFFIMLGSLIWGLADEQGWMEAGFVVKAFGLFALVAVMYIGAILRSDMERWVRFALLVSGTVLIVFVGFWGPSIINF
jgi:hypothetical protein